VDVQQRTPIKERTCPAAFLVLLKDAHGPRRGFLYVFPRRLGAEPSDVGSKRVDREEATMCENRVIDEYFLSFQSNLHTRLKRKNSRAKKHDKGAD